MPISCYTCVVFFVLLAHQLSGTSASEHCDTGCKDKPVFSPSELVVQYGASLSTTCTACESACLGAQFDVETAIGQRNRSEATATVVWTVDQVTEWDASALCYYNDQKVEDHQCCTELHVTVYQLPSQVSISLGNHSGPMLEGQWYTLQCAVQHAAPVAKLQVAFYKGQTRLPFRQPRDGRGLKKPQNETFTLDFTPGREDNGAVFWCEVTLDLDIPEGPPVVTSTNMTALVHYMPKMEPRPSEVISVTAGDPLHLSCRAEGNPAPKYQWKHPSRAHEGASYSGDFIINSTTFSDGGLYTCSASNSMGTATLTFQVEVRANYIPYIIGAGVVLCVLLLSASIIIYNGYRKKRIGSYNVVSSGSSKPVSQQKGADCNIPMGINGKDG